MIDISSLRSKKLQRYYEPGTNSEDTNKPVTARPGIKTREPEDSLKT